MDIRTINVLVLAYMGDAIYESYIRKYLIGKGINKVNQLQKESVNYVSAKAQAKYIQLIMDGQMLSNEELEVIKRARNNKKSSSPKNSDIITYKWATGLEALIGYLYLIDNNKRIEEIIKYIIKISEER